jgi:hypothetical protein
MNRRAIILMLIGTIASLAGFATSALLRQRRCGAAGGQWRGSPDGCRLVSGEMVDVTAVGDLVAGVGVAVVIAFMLFRILLLVMGRMSRRSL